MELRRHLLTAFLMTVVTTLLLGVAYPLLITAAAQVMFPEKANGQLIQRTGVTVGSRLIGQPFSSPGYFRSRPSAAGSGYDAAASSGSNLGPTNKTLIDRIDADVVAFRAKRPGVPMPIDLVTASGSGLDPHISPASAEYQVPIVARERGVSESEVRAAVARHSTGRTLGFLGEPVVNVLTLNLDLDEHWPMSRPATPKLGMR